VDLFWETGEGGKKVLWRNAASQTLVARNTVRPIPGRAAFAYVTAIRSYSCPLGSGRSTQIV
jgi:hypothetical protein